MASDPSASEIMKQSTSRMLFDYWNTVRNGRHAPQRFEIEPAKIAALLPETFILECGGLLNYRFRLAGTRICEQFGRELRGLDFLQLWNVSDRDPVANLLQNVVTESAVGAITFEGLTRDERAARFELLLLPLVHVGTTVNRIMGSITAQEAPYWLGSAQIIRCAVRSLDIDWPNRQAKDEPQATPPLSIFTGREATIAGDAKRRFRVFEGGLSESAE